MPDPGQTRAPILGIDGLTVGEWPSHLLRGVDLRLDRGVLAVVGDGHATLCKAILGLVPVAAGTIAVDGQIISGKAPADITRMGIGHALRGGGVWPSLTVDEHLRMVATGKGAWSVGRVYDTVPALAACRAEWGARLSGGQQQVLAISMALVTNPRLLVIDDATAGRAEDMVEQLATLLRLVGQGGETGVLLTGRDIDLAHAVADSVAIMVDGRIDRLVAAQGRAAGGARHAGTAPADAAGVVLVAGTLDTKGDELRFVAGLIRDAGLTVQVADLSTSGTACPADITARQIAAHHPQGADGVFTGDRGQAVAGMTLAFERWITQAQGIAGIISAGGSGGTALVTPAMRTLAVGIPKLMVSTVASGEVSKYVGASDITMMHSVADVQGLNAITREVLANAAHAIAGMVAGRKGAPVHHGKPAIGLTMFGVTTPAVQQVTAELGADHDCLVFHATGIGGRSMEKLIDSGKVTGVIDLTTTEVADLLMGGVFPATEDRFGAVIRSGMPYVGSVGALDMVNFAGPETLPERYRGRLFYPHNAHVTLMRTTVDECTRIGQWIGARLNAMQGPVRFLLPEGGVSALDAPGKPFHDPAARDALFAALEGTVRQTDTRRLIRLPHHINDPAFAAAVVAAFRALWGMPPADRKAPPR